MVRSNPFGSERRKAMYGYQQPEPWRGVLREPGKDDERVLVVAFSDDLTRALVVDAAGGLHRVGLSKGTLVDTIVRPVLYLDDYRVEQLREGS